MSIRQDDEGREVEILQYSLRNFYQPYDMPLTVDGKFGPITCACLVDFQRNRGLEVDGVVGPVTLQEIAEARRERWIAPNSNPIQVFLDHVPYLSQLDNHNRPKASCNVTALAMVFQALGVRQRESGKQFEDEIYDVITSSAGMDYYARKMPAYKKRRINPTTVHGMLQWAAAHYGLTGRFEMKAQIYHILNALRDGSPVILSGRFTGSGHLVVCIGVTKSNDLICHDPYKDWRYHDRWNGAARVYTYESLKGVLKERFGYSAPDQLWAHIFEKR